MLPVWESVYAVDFPWNRLLPAFWSSFHTRLMVAIADLITPQMSPQYYVEVESQTYQSDESDEEVLIDWDSRIASRLGNWCRHKRIMTL